MFQYNSAKEMKCFLDKNIDCKTKEDKDLLEQIKLYLDWPLHLMHYKKQNIYCKSS